MIAPGNLTAELTRLALCWRLARLDGVTLGFTSHDAALVIDGVAYEPASALRDVKVVLNDGIEADALEVSGALAAAAITAADLDAGRWASARATLFAVDWSDLAAGCQSLAAGSLGAVSRSDAGGFGAALISAAASLGIDAAPACSPGCRANLGDDRCRVDMSGRSRDFTVLGAGEGTLMVDASADQTFAHGRLRVLIGAAAGLEATMLSASGGAVQLLAPLGITPAAGDRVRLREGCDRTFSTCVSRFDNALNFRGEPFVPGTDTVIRYGEG